MRVPSGARVDGVLVVSAGLVAGGLTCVAPWETACAAAIVVGLGVLRGSVSALVALLATTAIAVGALRARRAVVEHEVERATTDAALGAPRVCSARATAISSPVRAHGVLRWDGALDRVLCDGEPVAWTGVATLYGGPADLARGDVAEVVARLASPERFWNPAGGDPRPSEARRGALRSGGTIDVRIDRRARGLFAWIDRVRARLRSRIDATFSPQVEPMARALVLGETDLAPEDDGAFRASGLSHLLAVSGMHLVLVLALALRTLEGLLSRVEQVAARVDVGRVAAAAGVPLAWLYGEIAGAGGSTLRAAWMMTAALLARAMGRRTDAVRAFGLSLAAMAAADPLVAFDLSFALSAGATAGLIAFGEPLGARLARLVPKILAPAAHAIGSTLAASLPCTPIIARFAPTVPLGGVAANLLAVPLGEGAALPLCLLHALMAWWPAAERGCALAASGALLVVRAIARVFSMPWLTAQVPCPTSWQLAVLAAAFGVLLLGARPRAALIAGSTGLLFLLEAGALRAGAPRGVLRATFLDVGQGDAAIVDLPDGEAMIIDGGGLVGSPVDVGLRVIAPELRARRRRSLAAVVLTHPHPDHFGGLATGLDHVRFGALWDTGQGQREGVAGGYAALIDHASARGVPILRPDRLCGLHAVGGVVLEVLAPCPDFSSDRGPNDNSIVMRISYGARAMLFVGDSEREEEGILLARSRDRLRADVLKVGHHGSRTSSTPGFIAAVAPREAVVSVGRRNRFGHPHPGTLALLAARGIRVWRTDRDGAVTVVTDGESLRVEAMASGP